MAGVGCVCLAPMAAVPAAPCQGRLRLVMQNLICHCVPTAPQHPKTERGGKHSMVSRRPKVDLLWQWNAVERMRCQDGIGGPFARNNVGKVVMLKGNLVGNIRYGGGNFTKTGEAGFYARTSQGNAPCSAHASSTACTGRALCIRTGYLDPVIVVLHRARTDTADVITAASTSRISSTPVSTSASPVHSQRTFSVSPDPVDEIIIPRDAG
ncbi:hypothetical protein BJ912DRAFT_936046 [Pholiota molesta]|nr:hypothetical protein BJ912DRAFT_936046 [Pholiota molesta]